MRPLSQKRGTHFYATLQALQGLRGNRKRLKTAENRPKTTKNGPTKPENPPPSAPIRHSKFELRNFHSPHGASMPVRVRPCRSMPVHAVQNQTLPPDGRVPTPMRSE